MRTIIPGSFFALLWVTAPTSATQWIHENAFGIGFPTDEWRASSETGDVVSRPQWSIDFSPFERQETSYPGCPSSLTCIEFLIDAPLEITVQDATALRFWNAGLAGQELTWTFLRGEDEAAIVESVLNADTPAAFIPPGTTRMRIEAPAVWRLRGVNTFEPATPEVASDAGLNVTTKSFVTGASLVADPLNLRYLYRINEGTLEQSGDLGDSWITLDAPLSRVVDIAANPGGSHILLALGTEGIARSEDRGLTWTLSLERPMGEFGDIHWSLNSGKYLIANDASDVWTSTDEGRSWEPQPALPEPASRIAGSNRSSAWILGESGLLYRQQDNSWEPDPRWSFVEGIKDVSVSECGLVAIAGGSVWRSEDGADFPAVRTAIGDGNPVIALEPTAEFCGLTLLIEDGRIIQTDQRLIQATTAQLPDGVRPARLAVHSVKFSDVASTYLLPEEGTLTVAALTLPHRCFPDQCNQTLRFSRTGFYIARLSLQPGEPEGLFGLSLNARPQGGFAAGAVLPAGGVQPGFLSFRLGFESPISALLSEYTGNVENLTLEIRQINSDGTRTTIWGPEQQPANSTLDIPAMGPGRFILSIRSGSDDPKGRFGVSLQAQSFLEGVDLGGWIDDSEQQPFMAYFSNGATNFTVFAEDSYPGIGAPQPDLSVRFQVPGGERVLVYPSELDQLPTVDDDLARLTDRFGNQLVDRPTNVAISGDGSTVAALIEDYDGDDIIDAFRWIDGSLAVAENVAVLDESLGGFNSLSAWAVNEDGSSVVYANSAVPSIYLYNAGETRLIGVPDEAIISPHPSLIMHDMMIYLSGSSAINGRTPYPPYGYLIPDETWTALAPENAEFRFNRIAFARDTATGWVLASAGESYLLVQLDLISGEDLSRRSVALPKRRDDSVVEVASLQTSNEGETVVIEIIERNPQRTLVRFQRIFAFDVESGDLQLVSAHADGSELERLASSPVVSGDGQSVFFRVPEALEPDRRYASASDVGYAVLRKNLETRALERVVDMVIDPQLRSASDNGNALLFSSYDRNLVPYDTNFTDHFVWRALAED